MIKVRPGHGMEEDCGISIPKAFFVISSEDAEGVQISHVSDPMMEGAAARSCTMSSKTGFVDRLRCVCVCVGIKVFRMRMDERCSFEGSPTNVTHPGRVVEAQSSHTWMHLVLSLVLLTPLKQSSESAHVRRNCSYAGLALVIARLL